ncbi:MAG: hypothetical protein JWO73_299 [Candidatus Taylorbacteria bacterium]|nr:hypothetical protein [Candidatus Taylorbacteria bacterium]
MKNFNLQNAIQDFKKAGLSQDEKRDMLARIMQKPAALPIKSPFLTFFPRRMAYAMVALLFVAGSVGTSYAAERAVPGDALYPVKIHVNESLRGVLSIKKEAKIEWEAEKAERRLAEARVLASQGRLDEGARKGIETKFNLHAEKFSEISNEDGRSDTNEKNAEHLHDKFEAGIKAETGKLDLIKGSSGDVQKHEIQELENAIKGKMQKIQKHI